MNRPWYKSKRTARDSMLFETVRKMKREGKLRETENRPAQREDSPAGYARDGKW